MSEHLSFADFSIAPDNPKDKKYVIAGNNGNWIIEKVFKKLGWKRVLDKTYTNYNLKWVETSKSVNFQQFKEGEQMVNRIPNCYLLTNKLGLLINLKHFHKLLCLPNQKNNDILNLFDFLPETYHLEDENEKIQFLNVYKPGELWILKPIGMNQGRDIQLIRDLTFMEDYFQEKDIETTNFYSHKSKLVQRYIMNPLLLFKRKFDMRLYLLIASTKPFIVLFRKGYIRLSTKIYDNSSEDMSVHLTNQFIQKRNPNYELLKNDTIWSFEKFNHYVNRNIAHINGLEQDWVMNALMNKMKQIALYCFLSVQDKLESKLGYFDLYGLDFLLDLDLKLWLLEINVNPCLATNCEHLKVIIPDVIEETIMIAVECFDKCKANTPLLPLIHQKSFEIIYKESSVKSYKFVGKIPSRSFTISQNESRNLLANASKKSHNGSFSSVEPYKNRKPFVANKENVVKIDALPSMFEINYQRNKNLPHINNNLDYSPKGQYTNNISKDKNEISNFSLEKKEKANNAEISKIKLDKNHVCIDLTKTYNKRLKKYNGTIRASDTSSYINKARENEDCNKLRTKCMKISNSEQIKDNIYRKKIDINNTMNNTPYCSNNKSSSIIKTTNLFSMKAKPDYYNIYNKKESKGEMSLTNISKLNFDKTNYSLKNNKSRSLSMESQQITYDFHVPKDYTFLTDYEKELKIDRNSLIKLLTQPFEKPKNVYKKSFDNKVKNMILPSIRKDLNLKNFQMITNK